MGRVLDLYWGGPERRITGLTLRIIAVNAIAPVILVIGILYLSQYQNTLIETKLETFKTEIELIAATLTESGFHDGMDRPAINRITTNLARLTGRRILVFGADGKLIIDSQNVVRQLPWPKSGHTLYSIEILKEMAAFVLGLTPDRKVLPSFPKTRIENAHDFDNAADALKRESSMSIWSDDEGGFILTAAAPVIVGDNLAGAVLIIRSGDDIEESLGQMWFDVLRIFLATLIVTTLLSIYLSGVIAHPLRRLARAAESVRTGKSKDTEIPDLSHRKDEIGELSVVLRDMMAALWERMDSIESFAADVAHELKNPLTSLRSAVETASIVEKKTDRDKLFSIIKHDVERLDRLINDISHASRLEAELSREDFKSVNISEALKQLIDIYKNPLERKDGNKRGKTRWRGVEIQLDGPGDVLVWGLEERLMQVFQNLISNALSFSPENGTVNVLIGREKNSVIVTVSDQGPGIPENKLETIFERFYSERPQHEDYGQHSGLGLSICRQIIEAHNGRIFAENLPEGGARFTVVLDAA